MKRGDEIISTGGHRAYITKISETGIDALSCTNCGALIIRKEWIGVTWNLTGKRHEELGRILEDICTTQTMRS